MSIGLFAATLTYNLILLGLVAVAWLHAYRQRNSRHAAIQVLLGLVGVTLIALVTSLVLCLPLRPLRAARLLCFGWFGHVPLYLLGVSWTYRIASRRISGLAALTLISLLGVAYYSFRVEPFDLRVTRYQVSSSRVTEPLTICLIADFQTDTIGDYQRDCLRRCMAERPDAILLAGDYLQSETMEGWERLRDQLRVELTAVEFGAPLGVVAVGGNTDYQLWPEIFADGNVHTVRETETIDLGPLSVTGLSVEASFDVLSNIRRPEQDQLHVVLGHAPDYALGEIDADLLLAGHTHGGQVCLPGLGPIVTFSQVPRAWASGLTRLSDQSTLVVSRGLGMERRDAPRLRFLCRPQLVFITIRPE